MCEYRFSTRYNSLISQRVTTFRRPRLQHVHNLFFFLDEKVDVKLIKEYADERRQDLGHHVDYAVPCNHLLIDLYALGRKSRRANVSLQKYRVHIDSTSSRAESFGINENVYNSRGAVPYHD